jgi:hypothetical protein
MFVIDWHFSDRRGSLTSASFEELMQDELLDEAYPSLGMPVARFVSEYASASETVLVLLGPPGMGKTRLVRSILGELSRRKGDSAEVMYTSDKRALENDEIYIEFITGSHEAFVIEDADHLLKARAQGNQDLHRFLSVADGVVRAQGRKIIFTTNLPNVGDLDDALLRPGRCFAVIRTQLLGRDAAEGLAARLCLGNAQQVATVMQNLMRPGVRGVSVADIYRACRDLGRQPG